MPTLNLGRVRFNMRGPYDPNSDYLTHDVVTDDGQSYVCIADVTGTGPNDAGGATYWEGMLLRGADYNAARDQAIQAASDAGSSASAAGQSATAAATNRDDAQAARDKSQAWAESDTAPEPGSKSAKTWAEEAASYGDPNQHNVTANGSADTRTAAEWAGQTLSNQQAINSLGTASAANVGTGANDVPKTSQADARYARLLGQNDFGTMPNVGGSPIVESDSNDNGHWTRWADGTQMCRNRKAADLGTNQGGLLFLSGVEFTTPMAQPFVDANYNVLPMSAREGKSGNSYQYAVMPIPQEDSRDAMSSTFGPKFRLGSLQSWGNLNASLWYTAWGRWKN
ncbi:MULTISPECIES: hypothetical protein [Halomonas]|uniref:hypothetical protein n=1 Tax=Halomonas TaxID=2745 RepID=UPI001C97339D|nr:MULTISPECIES: hypothetical protein [Halomonas]MBY6208769.1 hypothetical protein [Halomonas sp. DP3Y7-2]MBY6227239.1 hypothetical protein [Halomonas sp. DP3Y7-1]MCA0915011.1 hypothetical protein [Halomonas denitrificans]